MKIKTRFGLSIFSAFFIMLCAISTALYATTIDILLVYDSTATTWVNANGGMSTFSANVVAKMNQAMANSGIDVTWRLAHAASVNYTYSGDLSTDLQTLQSGSGALATVHTLRNTYGADVVAMLEDTGLPYGWVGQGYLLQTYSGSPRYAFTVNAVRSVEISHTLTHEVGHNMGCGHSKYQSSEPGPNSKLNSYSAGWYFTGNNSTKYHTIMAYDSDGHGNHYTEVPMFSSPLRTYQGATAGCAVHGDNARTINETKTVVAAYASSAPPQPTPNPNAGHAWSYAYYGEYYTAYAYYYYSYYDYYGYMKAAYYYADYAHLYAYYAYLYDATYGDDYGYADYAALYAYYGYLYAWYAYAYETGDQLSYNGALCEYYAYYYSYLVSIGQR